MCRRQSALLEVIREELLSQHGLHVGTVSVNAILPMACKMKMMHNDTFVCGAQGERDASNWQGLLANASDLPILQDTKQVGAWAAFGGGHDDLFIYDSAGVLFTHLKSARNRSTMDSTHVALETDAGFLAVKAQLMLAATASSARCHHEVRVDSGGAKPAAVTLPTDIATDLAVLTFLLGMLSERVRRKVWRHFPCYQSRADRERAHAKASTQELAPLTRVDATL